MQGTLVLFWAFAGIAVASSVLCITRRNPVASALWLVVTLFQVAALFVLLDAQFLAVLQVLVYAGAIMVLFLFVIMLLNAGRAGGGATDVRGPGGLAVATALAGALALQLVIVARTPPSGVLAPAGAQAAEVAEGMVAVVARPLFTTYLVPFEITSVLLLAAIVGAVVLAKRQL